MTAERLRQQNDCDSRMDATEKSCDRRQSCDRGQIGGFEVLPFGFLMFVSITLVLVNVWGVIDTKLAVTKAAREAIRVYVESTDSRVALITAKQRATETLEAYGKDGDRAIVGEPTTKGGYRRCGSASITVSYDLPVARVPFLGEFGNSHTVASTYTEVIDPFRSGLKGAAQC